MKYLITFLCLVCVPSAKADIALVLTDQEKQALIEILDIAVKAQGIQIAPNAAYIFNKLKNAPVITEQKPPTDDAKDPPQ